MKIEFNYKFLLRRLLGVDSPETSYRWRWFDTASPGHYKETETNGSVTNINYTIVYPSSDVRISFQVGLSEVLIFLLFSTTQTTMI